MQNFFPKLPNYLLIKKSLTYGLTIFATKRIPKGHIICITDIGNVDYIDGCITSPHGDIFNHSLNPNAKLRINSIENTKIEIISIKEIDNGDEILINYPNNGAKVLTTSELREQISKYA